MNQCENGQGQGTQLPLLGHLSTLIYRFLDQRSGVALSSTCRHLRDIFKGLSCEQAPLTLRLTPGKDRLLSRYASAVPSWILERVASVYIAHKNAGMALRNPGGFGPYQLQDFLSAQALLARMPWVSTIIVHWSVFTSLSQDVKVLSTFCGTAWHLRIDCRFITSKEWLEFRDARLRRMTLNDRWKRLSFLVPPFQGLPTIKASHFDNPYFTRSDLEREIYVNDFRVTTMVSKGILVASFGSHMDCAEDHR